MRLDLYTKFLLTVIAAALVLLVSRGTIVGDAFAQAAPTRCTGKLKANEFRGPEPARVTGFEVDVTCK